MNKRVRREANKMTNALMNADNIFDTYEEKKDFENRKPSTLENILLYWKIKKVIHQEYAKNLTEKYIIKDKAINSGRATIKGTRVTPDDIGRILFVDKDIEVKDIMEDYPSLSKEEEVLAGLIYYVDKHLSLTKILFAK
jgi:uncharacterized protein (DUF433 family)